MELDKKSQIADEIFFLVMEKLSTNEFKKFVMDDPDNDGTINTDLGSELYFDIEDILDDIE